jgi:uncharacterized protein (DUF1501 family)
MERRDFLKLASSVGLGVVAGSTLSGHAKSADKYEGPYYLMFHAGGGWDPTSFCDPKGAQSLAEMETNDAMNKSYLAGEIADAGPFKVAPLPGIVEFFQKHSSRLMVINGIDFATNSHDAGTRTAWTGTLQENKPAFAALVAGVYAPTQPMAFITYGGYDVSAGVVAVTRAGSPDLLRRIAFPHVVNPDAEDPADMYNFHSAGAEGILANARNERLLALQAKQQLPRLKNKMGLLYMARGGQNQLKQLVEFLPENVENGLVGQAQIAIAAMRAGVCVAANLSRGGFDTHGNHDENQIEALVDLFAGIDAAYEMAENFTETAGKVRYIAGSDFGRTPRYNDGNGKDHWSVTSMVMMGPGIPNRLIGESDAGHNPLTVNPGTLAVDPGGVRIKPGHIHTALRKLAGIHGNDIVNKFPLQEPEELNLFG